MQTQTPLQSLAGQIRFKLDKKVAERLTELDRIHLLGMERLGDLSSTDLKNIWTQLQRRALDALRKAKTSDDVEQIGEPSKQAIQAAAADARLSMKHSLREISKEARDVAIPEVMRFVSAATSHVDQLQNNEKEISASFGVFYEPSVLISALREEVSRLKAIADKPWHGGIQRPADFVSSFSPLS
jgi:hypothetical protein